MSQPNIQNSQKTKMNHSVTCLPLYCCTLWLWGPGVCSSSVFLKSNAWWLQTYVASTDLNWYVYIYIYLSSGHLSIVYSQLYDIWNFLMQLIMICLSRCRFRCPGPSASPTVSTRRSSLWCCPSCLILPSATQRFQRRRGASTWAWPTLSR